MRIRSLTIVIFSTISLTVSATDLYISMIDAQTSQIINMADDNSSQKVIEKKLRFPVDKSAKLARGYHVQCKGSQEDLKIEVLKESRRILDTTVGLLTGKKFILGKFPSAQGKFKIVFVAK